MLKDAFDNVEALFKAETSLACTFSKVDPPPARELGQVFALVGDQGCTKHPFETTLPGVESLSRSSAGKDRNLDKVRHPLALEKSMHFLVHHYLRAPKDPLKLVNHMEVWEYLWDRMRQIRTDWTKQLHVFTDPLQSQRMKWLQFNVASMFVAAAVRSRNRAGCARFMENKNHYMESVTQSFSDLLSSYRVEGGFRCSEFISVMALFYGLRINSKCETNAGFCRWDKGRGYFEDPCDAVGLFDVYKELEYQPQICSTRHVQNALRVVHCVHQGNWLEYFELCKSLPWTALQRCVLFCSFSYMRYRAIMTLMCERPGKVVFARFRRSMAVVELADLLMFDSTEDCLEFLTVIGVSEFLTQDTQHLQLCDAEFKPLICKELIGSYHDRLLTVKESISFPPHRDFIGFQPWAKDLVIDDSSLGDAMGSSRPSKWVTDVTSQYCSINCMEILEPYTPNYTDELERVAMMDAEEDKWFGDIRAKRREMLGFDAFDDEASDGDCATCDDDDDSGNAVNEAETMQHECSDVTDGNDEEFVDATAIDAVQRAAAVLSSLHPMYERLGLLKASHAKEVAEFLENSEPSSRREVEQSEITSWLSLIATIKQQIAGHLAAGAFSLLKAPVRVKEIVQVAFPPPAACKALPTVPTVPLARPITSVPVGGVTKMLLNVELVSSPSTPFTPFKGPSPVVESPQLQHSGTANTVIAEPCTANTVIAKPFTATSAVAKPCTPTPASNSRVTKRVRDGNEGNQPAQESAAMSTSTLAQPFASPLKPVPLAVVATVDPIVAVQLREGAYKASIKRALASEANAARMLDPASPVSASASPHRLLQWASPFLAFLAAAPLHAAPMAIPLWATHAQKSSMLSMCGVNVSSVTAHDPKEGGNSCTTVELVSLVVICGDLANSSVAHKVAAMLQDPSSSGAGVDGLVSGACVSHVSESHIFVRSRDMSVDDSWHENASLDSSLRASQRFRQSRSHEFNEGFQLRRTAVVHQPRSHHRSLIVKPRFVDDGGLADHTVELQASTSCYIVDSTDVDCMHFNLNQKADSEKPPPTSVTVILCVDFAKRDLEHEQTLVRRVATKAASGASLSIAGVVVVMDTDGGDRATICAAEELVSSTFWAAYTSACSSHAARIGGAPTSSAPCKPKPAMTSSASREVEQNLFSGGTRNSRWGTHQKRVREALQLDEAQRPPLVFLSVQQLFYRAARQHIAGPHRGATLRHDWLVGKGLLGCFQTITEHYSQSAAQQARKLVDLQLGYDRPHSHAPLEKGSEGHWARIPMTCSAMTSLFADRTEAGDLFAAMITPFA